MDRRLPTDVARAKKLLAQAGYPDGFSVSMDCDVRTERVCGALAGQLAKGGIRLNLVVASPALYYGKIQRMDTSMYLMGWVSTLDAIFTLRPLMHSRNDRGDGEWNFGRFRDEKLDALIDAVKVEFDAGKRRERTVEALRLVHENAYLIPLYRRMYPWASRANVEVVYRPDTWLETTWVKKH